MAGRIVARNFYTVARWAGMRCNPVRFLSYNVQKFNSPSTKLLWGKSTNFPILAPAASFRFYGDDVKMTVRELEDRVLTVLQLFDKVDPEKVIYKIDGNLPFKGFCIIGGAAYSGIKLHQ